MKTSPILVLAAAVIADGVGVQLLKVGKTADLQNAQFLFLMGTILGIWFGTLIGASKPHICDCDHGPHAG